MDKISPNRIFDQYITKAFHIVDLPESNNPELQKDLSDLMIAIDMAKLATATKDKLTKRFKQDYSTKIDAISIGDTNVIEQISSFRLSVKKSTPRETFDKGEFIKLVAQKTNISMAELHSLADKSTKKSVAPLSFSVDFMGSNDE
jgi:LysM repeat protein